jgi:glucans biosynthesis protein
MDQDRLTRQLVNLRAAPRCGAKTRAGTLCRCPAIHGRLRCRIHGGALGSGAPRGAANGNYRDGYWTREAVEERKFVRLLVKGHFGGSA